MHAPPTPSPDDRRADSIDGEPTRAARPAPAARRGHHHASVAMLLLLLVVGVVLYWITLKGIGDYEDYQRQIMERSVIGAANQISLQLDNLKTSLELFVHGHRDQLRRLAVNPDNTTLHTEISAAIGQYYPDYYSFTLSDKRGELLYDDFGERVGELCRRDIQSFASRETPHRAYIHPGPGEYHIDIMTTWDHHGPDTGVFFVSFKPDMIARLLEDAQVAGHELFLVRSDVPELIEISAEASRAQLARDIRLSPEEVARVGFTQTVNNTRWLLIDIPTATLGERILKRELNQAAILAAAFLLIGGFTLVFVRREEARRAAAETALRNSHGQLEQRVKERTAALQTSNIQLQREVIDRTVAERELRKLSSAVEHTDDVVVITDHNGIIEYVNPAFEAKTGYRRDEALGRTPSLLKSGMHDTDFYREMWAIIGRGEVFRDVMINRRKDGALYYEEKTITPLRGDDGALLHFVSTGKDITERMETQERLHFLAHHDVLTGLPNRALLRDRLTHAIAQAHRNGTHVAILFLDLDRFKTINDSLGHAAGDRLLTDLAQRLGRCMREGDTVARLGGDEFTVVLEGLHETGHAAIVAQKLLGELVQPFGTDGRELFVTASIGITVYPIDSDNIETLMQNADAAMYRAKERGGDTYEFFTRDMTQRAVERLDMENQLRRALEREEFELHYQPRFDLRAGRVLGFEALLRWRHPELGVVSPAQFIPLLEETGLIIPVGDWVLARACADTRSLNSRRVPPLRLAVNLSARQFRDPHFLEHVRRALDATELDPRQLEVEITESVLVDNVERTAATLQSLHDLGVQVSIDDFGTGYSSMSYLQRFPIDWIKIDRSFTRDVATDPDDAALVDAIIAMARALRLKVTAEGVENERQLHCLRDRGCDEVQGYLIARPMPYGKLVDWLADALPLTAFGPQARA